MDIIKRKGFIETIDGMLLVNIAFTSYRFDLLSFYHIT